MGFYSPNANLKGSKVVYTSESAVSLGSSSLPAMLVLPIDPAYMQDSFSGYTAGGSTDAYESCQTNTLASQLIYQTNATNGVKKNELQGLYAYVASLDEARLIDGNTAAANGANTTVYVSRPFSTAPSAGDEVNIRRWEKLYVPKLIGSLEEFAEMFIARDSADKYTWTNCEAAYDTIVSYKNAGGGFFFALPVEVNATMGSIEAAANMSATTNSDFLVSFDALSSPPSTIVLAKQSSLPVTVASADWATADAAWTTFVDNRATSDTTDEDMTAMAYITDTPSASASAAITYRATTWAPTSERAVLVHGLHNVADGINGGRSREVNAAPAFAGAMNRVSTSVPESFGHAFSGAKTVLGGIKSLSEDLTQANRVLLQSNGINSLIFKRGKGYYFENQYTMAANTGTGGENPEEHLHIIISRNKIWNAAKAKLAALIDEQNVVSKRQTALTELSILLDGYKTQRVVRDYAVADTTTSNDESLGIARFAMSVLFPVPIGWVELTLNSRI